MEAPGKPLFLLLLRRLNRLSLWTLAITAVLAAVGLARLDNLVLRNSPTSQTSLFLTPVGIGIISVQDESGTCIPLYSRGRINNNIVLGNWHNTDFHGYMALFYRHTTHLTTISGSEVTARFWRLTYIPQVLIALIMPMISVVGWSRRFWPLVGVWDNARQASSPVVRRLLNLLSAVSLILCAVTLGLWAVSYYLPGAMPSPKVGSERGISFHDGAISLMSVTRVPDAVWQKHSPNETGPFFAVAPIHSVPYWCLMLLTGFLPIGRGLMYCLFARRRVGKIGAGLCPNCGYDLRMSKDRCPECGQAFVRETVIVAVRAGTASQ